MGQLLGVRIRVKSLLPRAQVSSMGTNIDISHDQMPQGGGASGGGGIGPGPNHSNGNNNSSMAAWMNQTNNNSTNQQHA